MIAGYSGKARLSVESFGSSPFAERFGITRYPAIFVNDILVATPDDFGFFGNDDPLKSGRYAPWTELKSHERFRDDLKQMIDLALGGHSDQIPRAAMEDRSQDSAPLPALRIPLLDGQTLDTASLAGRVVVVELWATWCPPCKRALTALAARKRLAGDPVEVLALAVQSPEAQVRAFATTLAGPVRVALASPELVRKLGDLVALPTVLVFDRQGRRVTTLYGAPDDLEATLERVIQAAK